MVTLYIKGATRCIFTHIHLQAGWYIHDAYTYVCNIRLLLHITVNPSSIVTEECKFLSIQVQYIGLLCEG